MALTDTDLAMDIYTNHVQVRKRILSSQRTSAIFILNATVELEVRKSRKSSPYRLMVADFFSHQNQIYTNASVSLLYYLLVL